MVSAGPVCLILVPSIIILSLVSSLIIFCLELGLVVRNRPFRLPGLSILAPGRKIESPHKERPINPCFSYRKPARVELIVNLWCLYQEGYIMKKMILLASV